MYFILFRTILMEEVLVFGGEEREEPKSVTSDFSLMRDF